MLMTTLDWIIIAIITLSTVVSLWRGVTREVFSLITWVGAAYLGVKFATPVSELFTSLIDAQSVRYAAGFILIFIVVLIVGSVLSMMLTRLVSAAGLSIADRLLGVFFGAARGVLIIAIGIVLFNFTNMPKDDWWKSSQLLPHFEGMADSITRWIEAQGLNAKKVEEIKHTVSGEEPAAPVTTPEQVTH